MSTRMVKGVQVPVAGAWKLDPGHAEVGFVGRHFMFSRIRGRFTRVEATIVIGEDPLDSHVEAVIDMSSVDSGDAARDEHLRSADHFDVKQYETATFRSRSVEWDGGTSGRLHGDLTIKGVTRPITLDVDYLGFACDPWGNEKVAFSARGVIDRTDFGLTWNMVLDTGNLLVSRKIELVLDFEAVRERPGA